MLRLVSEFFEYPLMYQFCLFENVFANIFIKLGSHLLLILWITRFYVHRNHHCDEPQLFLAQFVFKSTAI